MQYFILIENRKITVKIHCYVYFDHKVLCMLDCPLKKKNNHTKPVKTHQIYFNFSSPSTAFKMCASYK